MALDLRPRNGCYSTGQVAILLGCSRGNVYQLVKAGKLKGYYMSQKEGTKIIVTKEDLRKYLMRRRLIG